jgi:hypothetical protein
VTSTGKKKKQPRGGFVGCFQGVSKVIEVILAVKRQGWFTKVRRLAIDKTDTEFGFPLDPILRSGADSIGPAA